MSERDATPPWLAIGLVSAAALAYEILLMRLFSILLWHHFAFMMISVALLGYGAAGAFVALARPWLEPRFTTAFVASCAAFGFAAPLCFEIAQRLDFNPLELPWDTRQLAKLFAIYVVLALPFFAVATCLSLAFARYRRDIHRIYAADILGAGVGALAILAALFVLAPATALVAIAVAGLLAAAAAAFAFAQRALAALMLIAAAALALAVPAGWPALSPSPYKDLSQALRVKGARIAAEASSPLGLVSVVENRVVALRHAPGLSLNAIEDIPEQLGVYIDGDGPAALVRFDGRRETLAYLDQLTSALPYHLLVRPRVLVLGAGAGSDVLQAAYHSARAIDAVELNPQVVDLTEARFAAFSGRPYASTNARVHRAEARGFVSAGDTRFDLVQLPPLDAFSASSAGLHSLSENPVYTVEALRAYLRRVDSGGLLAITRWVRLPPRELPRLFATAIAALEAEGVAAPERRLAVVRGWKTATLLVRNGEFGAEQIAAIRAFCAARSFDVEYYPGITPPEANRYNVLDRPYFFDAFQALAGSRRDAFIADYKYDIVPATDDRPYFHHFFRWRSAPEILALKARGGAALLDWGYPVLVATLVQAIVAALALILVPLGFLRRREAAEARPAATRAAALALYFLAVGFAFMFVEIAFLQKSALLLAHPLYAIGVVLASFLVFAGAGSALSQRLGDAQARAPALAPVIAIAALILAYLAVPASTIAALTALPDPARIAITVAAIAPLALAMGMPFPLALARVSANADTFVAWAWGINACASVVGAILATLVAIHAGFTVLLLAAIALYLFALTVFPAAPVVVSAARRGDT